MGLEGWSGASAAPGEALRQFETQLAAQGYLGTIERDHATRTVFATDNSVYELLPQAVLYPREPDDLNRIMRAAAAAGVALAARGGGTGTNGQSLSDAIVVDCSRHLDAIESIDPERQIAVVQPGVILDQLNRAAGRHGLFFAPTVSTASRATLGGMAATDASGKGSRLYGRTSDHVIGMDVVLSDGSDLRVEALEGESLAAMLARPDRAGAVHRAVKAVIEAEATEIARVYPVMNRGLTGYNLRDVMSADGRFTLTRLLCGSEGTLSLTKRLTLRLTRKPALKAILVIAYDDALAALADVGRLTEADPAAIEFIDDRILSLATTDPVWATLESVLSTGGDRPVRGLNVLEVVAADAAELAARRAVLESLRARAPASVIAEIPVDDPATMAEIWSLRAKCVGLLGRMDAERQGTAFVEDAAVPPEQLADFVAGFRAILDAEGLAYGMFGHADVGCVHVRPALDMRLARDRAMIRRVSDQVAALAARHGGLIWGEHGKGFRGEYGPQIFGERLYAGLCSIKGAFDPDNRLNPGKLAGIVPQARLSAIDAVPFRGARDAQILPALAADFADSVKCNGNGQCFGRDPDERMCPSYKATGDRLKSPKGRAAMIREWLRLQSDVATGGEKAGAAGRLLPELELRLYESLSDCLGCKACASQCPVKVDIPAMRSRFLETYYRRHRRPLRHHLLAAMESAGPLLRIAPALTNAAFALASPLLRRLGLVDLPPVAVPRRRRRLPPRVAAADGRSVVLVEDTFLGTFDGSVIDAAEALLTQLGYAVARTPPLANGKALSVLGLNARFARTATRSLRRLSALAAAGHRLVGIEPAVLAMQAGEWAKLGIDVPAIEPIDRFLAGEIAAGRIAPQAPDATAMPLSIFTHCTEQAADPRVGARWQAILVHFGLAARSQATGCCGMAGTFGHEAEHLAMSRRLYDLSWKARIGAAGQQPLVTGFSCRCQVERFEGERPLHPLHALAHRMQR